MLTKSITYEDFNGVTQTEKFYFNFTKAELIEMNYEINGGLEALIEQIQNTRDMAALINLFKGLILRAYGEKTLDGKQFRKSQELRDNFAATEAYSVLFMQLATDAKQAAAFINGVIPKSLLTEIQKTPEYHQQMAAIEGVATNQATPE